jgi:hypothetical protein
VKNRKHCTGTPVYLVLAGAGREAVVAAAVAAAVAVAQQGRRAGRQRPGVAAVWAVMRAVPPPSNFAVPVKKRHMII